MKAIESREAGFDPARLQRVVEALRKDIHAERYDGAALHVGRRGRTVLQAVEGFANRAAQKPLTEDTVFISMSIGKQFMNALVLSFVERGLLGLHTPVQDVLPGFGVRGKGGITLWHLLTHTSGIMSAVPALPVEVLTSVEKMAAFAAGSLPESLPGERVNYSIILGHSIMAAMLLKVDGGKRSLTQLLDAEVFQPLGMRDTSLGVRPDLRARLAPIAVRYKEPGLFTPEEMEGLGALVQVEGAEIPAGGYTTTIADLARFTAMLQGRGELDGYRLLSPATLKLAARNWTGQLPNNIMSYSMGMRGWAPWPASIGLGFFVRGEGLTPGPIGNLASPNTFGGWGAGSTCFWVDPERELTFSFLSTGLMEDSHHIERLSRLSDLVLSAMTH
ncbi:serine hydrolase domain-containing protein [Pyxidicoccus xibeiensis]|uniref:serine hydrolase domain-containing protein n=1 Tax=Pyxidicoccus xibeiensis TaxID=2906759 RepID=UPI0020A7B439|nr:serine hydrolase domain-containing protein [Pyxidicoccus xibeiensis]MCP3143233.1 beta-lactamase family protein [Pyxidicoccus xibeiensis]